MDTERIVEEPAHTAVGLQVRSGATVWFGGEFFKVLDVLPWNRLLCRGLFTGRWVTLDAEKTELHGY